MIMHNAQLAEDIVSAVSGKPDSRNHQGVQKMPIYLARLQTGAEVSTHIS